MSSKIDLRARAIAYARQQPLSGDMVASLDGIKALLDLMSNDDFMELSKNMSPEELAPRKLKRLDALYVQLRIGIDNMVAAGFEMGYEARGDDARPRRALGGAAERSVKSASKSKRKR